MRSPWPPLPAEEHLPIAVLALFTVGFAAYFFLWHSQAVRRALERRFGPRRGAILLGLHHKALMVFWFGLLPAALLAGVFRLRFSEYGLRGFPVHPTLWVTLAFSALAGLAAYFNPAHVRPGGQYPSMRVDRWSFRLWLLEATSWGIYLLAYEFMFRGLLLHALLPWGAWPAIAVNTALYTCTHLHKGPQEAFGALFLGILLCLLTLWAGSLWPAYLIHLSLAVFNSLGAVARNPALGFGRAAGS